MAERQQPGSLKLAIRTSLPQCDGLLSDLVSPFNQRGCCRPDTLGQCVIARHAREWVTHPVDGHGRVLTSSRWKLGLAVMTCAAAADAEKETEMY